MSLNSFFTTKENVKKIKENIIETRDISTKSPVENTKKDIENNNKVFRYIIKQIIDVNSWSENFILDVDQSWKKYLEPEVKKPYFQNLIVFFNIL